MSKENDVLRKAAAGHAKVIVDLVIVKDQRDDLLAALKQMVRRFTTPDNVLHYCGTFDKAKDAIAKAERERQ